MFVASSNMAIIHPPVKFRLYKHVLILELNEVDGVRMYQHHSRFHSVGRGVDVRKDIEVVHAIGVHWKITCGSVSSPHMKHNAQVVNV